MKLPSSIWHQRLYASLGILLGVFAIIVLLEPRLTKNALATLSASLIPIADGSFQNWSGPGFSAVDESACNGNVDYVYTSSTNPVTNRESYLVSLSSIPATSTITKITITPCASANISASPTATSSIIDVFYRYNGQNSADQGNYAVTGTVPTTLASTVYSNLFLSKTPTSSLQIGVRLASGTIGARLSKIAATVNYAIPTVASGTPLIQDGTYAQWGYYGVSTSSASSTHYKAVQMTYGGACNGTTDYVYTTTPGAMDSYVVDLSSIPQNAFITNIDIQPCASLELCPATNQSGTLTSSMSVFYRLNGVQSPTSVAYTIPVGTIPKILPARSFSIKNVSAQNMTLEVGATFNSGPLGVRLSGLAPRITYIVPDP